MNIEKISRQDHLLEGFCRGCLIKYDNPTDLLQYTEKNRRLFVYSTGLQVKRNDTFTFQLCKDCYVNMKLSCKFKKQCRTSDKRFKGFVQLREIGDIDLCTFLKNSDDTLKFPLISGNSTPSHQRVKDDDNDSTCTSIQNFMTDILQGTEMPDTEARIIKEVIEEEADVLEDSIDSHWLQDDVSIDTDFRLDFSFSPFSTSRSVNNDHCYTPTKPVETTQINSNNHAKKVLEQLPTCREDDYDSRDISLNGINEALQDICGKSQMDLEEDYMQDNLIEECIDVNEEIPMFDTDPSIPELVDITDNNFGVNNEIDMAVKSIDISFESVPGVNKKNFYVLNELSEELNVGNVIELPTQNAIMSEFKQNTGECSIDKKLKQALENNNEEIPLADLLVSPAGNFSEAVNFPTPKNEDMPQVIVPKTIKDNEQILSTPSYSGFPDGAGASTPLINNILFGDKLELDSNSGQKVGQCIEKFENVAGYIDAIEKFFEDGVKEFDQNENSKPEKTELNVEDFSEDVKVPTADSLYDIEEGLCKICDKKFTAIKIHLVKIHKMKFPKKKYVDTKEKMCNICGIIIKDRSNYWRHLKTHDKIEFKCDVCTLPFESKWKLRQHAKSHNSALVNERKRKKKDTRYICSVCGASFELSGNFLAHMKRHESPTFACAECGKSFFRSTDLKRHERSHSGERPFVCPMEGCGKSYAAKFNLVNHMRHHTAEKPYECDNCGSKFTRKSLLIRHILKSVNCLAKRGGQSVKKQKRPKKYECYFCVRKYTTKEHLIKHQERSAACIKIRDEMENRNRSTIKVQMPFMYPDTSNIAVIQKPAFNIEVKVDE